MSGTRPERQERRVRFAALLVVIGVLVELVSLRWAHPTAFLVFALGAATLLALAAFLCLVTLVSTGPDDPPDPGGASS